MAGIGMNFAASPVRDANIEDTLIFASEAGMLEGDLRVLGVLVQWIEVHGAHINADRLARTLARHDAPRVRAFWAAVGVWLGKDRRFARLKSLYAGSPVDLLPTGTDFQIRRRGEDERFSGTCLRVPAGTLRKRRGDVLSPEELARRHAGYRNRVLMGPSWRADVWTVLEANPDLPVAEVARRAYCAFATAWQVKRDFELFQEADSRGRWNGRGRPTRGSVDR
jgi:hypothetical protein